MFHQMLIYIHLENKSNQLDYHITKNNSNNCPTTPTPTELFNNKYTYHIDYQSKPGKDKHNLNLGSISNHRAVKNQKLPEFKKKFKYGHLSHPVIIPRDPQIN
jgi:hypothetical protein